MSDTDELQAMFVDMSKSIVSTQQAITTQQAQYAELGRQASALIDGAAGLSLSDRVALLGGDAEMTIVGTAGFSGGGSISVGSLSGGSTIITYSVSLGDGETLPSTEESFNALLAAAGGLRIVEFSTATKVPGSGISIVQNDWQITGELTPIKKNITATQQTIQSLFGTLQTYQKMAGALLDAITKFGALRPLLFITPSHSGSLVHNTLSAVTWEVIISNIGPVPTTTDGVEVDIALPPGVVNSMSGAGWTFTSPRAVFNRTDVLGPGLSYPPIFITMDLTDINDQPSTILVLNVEAFGGGSNNAGAQDRATVV